MNGEENGKRSGAAMATGCGGGVEHLKFSAAHLLNG